MAEVALSESTCSEGPATKKRRVSFGTDVTFTFRAAEPAAPSMGLALRAVADTLAAEAALQVGAGRCCMGACDAQRTRVASPGPAPTSHKPGSPGCAG